jgi:hypothetical protein
MFPHSSALFPYSYAYDNTGENKNGEEAIAAEFEPSATPSPPAAPLLPALPPITQIVADGQAIIREPSELEETEPKAGGSRRLLQKKAP